MTQLHSPATHRIPAKFLKHSNHLPINFFSHILESIKLFFFPNIRINKKLMYIIVLKNCRLNTFIRIEKKKKKIKILIYSKFTTFHKCESNHLNNWMFTFLLIIQINNQSNEIVKFLGNQVMYIRKLFIHLT